MPAQPRSEMGALRLAAPVSPPAASLITADATSAGSVAVDGPTPVAVGDGDESIPLAVLSTLLVNVTTLVE